MMCSLRHAYLISLIFISTQLLPTAECSENDLLTTTAGTVHRCYWCGPGAEQVHRSRRVGACSADGIDELIECDPGFPYCAVVATAPPQIISRKCVKEYQDDCYTRYCKTSQLWKLTCPCKGDLCNGPITEREKTALTELMGKFNKTKRSIQNITDLNNVEVTAVVLETSLSVMDPSGENKNLDPDKGNNNLDPSKGNDNLDPSKSNKDLDPSKGNKNLDSSKGNKNLDLNKGNNNLDPSKGNKNLDPNKEISMEEVIKVQQRIVNDDELNKDLDKIGSSVNSFMNQYPIDNIVPKDTKDVFDITVPTIGKPEATIQDTVTEKPSITIVKPSSMPPIESLQQTITPTTMNNEEKVTTTTIMTTAAITTETTTVTNDKSLEESDVIVTMTTAKPKKVRNQSRQLVANVSLLISCLFIYKTSLI